METDLTCDVIGCDFSHSKKAAMRQHRADKHLPANEFTIRGVKRKLARGVDGNHHCPFDGCTESIQRASGLRTHISTHHRDDNGLNVTLFLMN
jgi:hypothetical protein